METSVLNEKQIRCLLNEFEDLMDSEDEEEIEMKAGRGIYYAGCKWTPDQRELIAKLEDYIKERAIAYVYAVGKKGPTK